MILLWCLTISHTNLIFKMKVHNHTCTCNYLKYIIYYHSSLILGCQKKTNLECFKVVEPWDQNETFGGVHEGMYSEGRLFLGVSIIGLCGGDGDALAERQHRQVVAIRVDVRQDRHEEFRRLSVCWKCPSNWPTKLQTKITIREFELMIKIIKTCHLLLW